MNAIGRLFLIVAGLAVAITTALIVLPLLIVFDPIAGGGSLLDSLGSIIETLNDAEDLAPEEALSLFGGFLWAAALMICVIPVTLVALVGEIAAMRSFVWYMGGSGLLAAAMPWLARAATHMREVTSAKPLELRLALLFFLTGTAAGFVYWLICGRSARSLLPTSKRVG